MKHRFVLIGCGRIGRRHAVQMAKAGTLAAVCDTDTAQADLFAHEFQATPYYQLEALLHEQTDISLAAICTPNYLHAPQSIQCLLHGVNVLCEKPMAISVAGAAEMLETARRCRLKLFVVKQNRFNPPVQLVKNMLNEGRLGRVHAFQVNCFWNRPPAYYNSPWKGKKALDGGILFTQFSHFIDLLIWLLGEAKSVTAVRNNFLLKEVIETEDTGFALVTMHNGSIGTINYTVTSFAKNMEGSITLFGNKGTVKVGGQYLNELEYFCVDGEQAPQLPDGRQANDYGYYHGSMSNHDLVYENVLKALNNTQYDIVEGTEAMKTVQLIETIYNCQGVVK